MPNSIFQSWHQKDLKSLFSSAYKDIGAQKKQIKQRFQHIVHEISAAFLSRKYSIDKILLTYNKYIDVLLRCFCPTFNSISVIAIGGYGRKERALYSDIDLLFLVQNDQLLHNQRLFEYIDVLQSLPVRIGYCTHNFDSLITYANNDVHLLTALIDARFICGSDVGMVYLKEILHNKKNLPCFHDFFIRKCQEQKARDYKYPASGVPDIKNTVGNLRYLHMLYWLFKFMFPKNTINRVVQQKYISQPEVHRLKNAHCLFSEIRFYLHIYYQRQENRLLLDGQQAVINFFSVDSGRPIEPFMYRYHKTTQEVSRINYAIIARFANSVNLPKP